MAVKFQKGDIVKLNLSVPTGPVVGFKIDDDGNVSYLLEWIDHDGQKKQRWFQEHELTLG
jgi:uncharacterized protein YodC (DUF2158 family)